MFVFIGSLMLVPYTRSPTNFAFCQGQLLSIPSNTALFSLLGTYYGGNGTSNFGLPTLPGCHAIGYGQGSGISNYVIGETGGTPTVTLQTQQVTPHTHQAMGTDAISNSVSPTSSALGKPNDNTQLYTTNVTNQVQMQSQSVQMYGSGGPHNNMMPFETLNWIIALQGIYPQRS